MKTASGISAFAGAISGPPTSEERWYRSELVPAVAAEARQRTSASASRNLDGELSSSDEITVASSGSVGVATGAARDEILGAVVCSVPIQVVGNDHSCSRPVTWLPVHRTATPVAGVRSGADLLKKSKSSRVDSTGGRGERVPRIDGDESLNFGRRGSMRASCRGRVAPAAAETVRATSLAGFERLSALLTRAWVKSFHAAILTHR